VTPATRLAGWMTLAIATACGSSSDKASPPEQFAASVADGIADAIERADRLAEPFHCAELFEANAEPATQVELAGIRRVATIEGYRMHLVADGGRRDREVVLGVVSDARGAGAETLAEIARMRGAFEEAGVELVVSLGGMGKRQDEIEPVLAALSRGAPWPLWALPGDREELPAHRAAVASLRGAGAAVFDGSAIRFVDMGGVTLGSLPGGAHPGRLVAGRLGCHHRAHDGARLADELARADGVRVWVGQTPPRQRGPASSDLATGGIHVGETELASLVTRAGAHVVLHGLVDEAALGKAAGRAALVDGAAPVVLGTGPLDASPLSDPTGPVYRGAALVLEISPRTARWSRIRTLLAGKSQR